MWDLLSRLYATDIALSQLSEDRRRSYAAGLIVRAWKARQGSADPSQGLQKPDFVVNLEAQVSRPHRGLVQDIGTKAGQDNSEQSGEPVTSEAFPTEPNIDAIFDFDLQDIDWSFWSSID